MAGYNTYVLSNNLECLVVWYLLGPMDAGLKEYYGTTLTFPTWSCEYHYTVSIDKFGYRA